MIDQLIADALENVVSAFDGFGRELCHVYAQKSTNPVEAEAISFQNLAGAQKRVHHPRGRSGGGDQTRRVDDRLSLLPEAAPAGPPDGRSR